NLSITQSAVIEDTHRRMARSYHPAGGRWQRSFMPRTVFVFVDAQPGVSSARRKSTARARAHHALSAYWRALEGTLDEAKVTAATHNALIGDPEDVAQQIVERFHPDDRLMLWFDFFADDGTQVTTAMSVFSDQVIPALRHRGVPA
ncbi:MAG TPA: hypothetical protein VFQ48_08365, partial [Pseudonocardiaceae bacterium]|nr:hypothetical protein [Pseudonocardiaceae bacterium]